MSLKVAPPEEIAKLRAEADAREEMRRTKALQEKEKQQLRRVASFVKAVEWIKGLFTPPPATDRPSRRRRSKAQWKARKQQRGRDRAARLKENAFIGGSTTHNDRTFGKRLTKQEREATRKGWNR